MTLIGNQPAATPQSERGKISVDRPPLCRRFSGERTAIECFEHRRPPASNYSGDALLNQRVRSGGSTRLVPARTPNLTIAGNIIGPDPLRRGQRLGEKNERPRDSELEEFRARRGEVAGLVFP
jgi:hypothetical protein